MYVPPPPLPHTHTSPLHTCLQAFRAGAIRALCTITDSQMLQGIERFFKQALVDKSAAVTSSALVSSLHLMKDSHDVVKRWVNEVTQVRGLLPPPPHPIPAHSSQSCAHLPARSLL